ncbi:phage protein [Aliarcobacter butzleri JV22]|uniref:PH domain-containing protein n=1 Tax=Aliarcobacter butzleri TaxID=28197 RepID=UPI0001F14CC0|nr:PH domain-containing protein [Aliarcobacter butzleri]EFU69158.1 phage protein [Aliarcobacter butzleri JV22]
MPTLEQIKSQITNLDNISKFGGKKEIKELPSILWEDEIIKKLEEGMYKNGIGLLVATNKRLIFVNKSIFSLKVEDFGYDKITSIEYKKGLLMGEITIYASGNRAEITSMGKNEAQNFAEFIRANLGEINKEQKNDTLSKAVSNDDIVSKLERLVVLKEKGILTDEEFLSQKTKILSE